VNESITLVNAGDLTECASGSAVTAGGRWLVAGSELKRGQVISASNKEKDARRKTRTVEAGSFLFLTLYYQNTKFSL
jgi:hypothetical protein